MDPAVVFTYYILLFLFWAEIVKSVQQLATGWMFRGSNPSGGKIFCIRPDQPWGPPSFLNNGYPIIPRGKTARTWC